MDFANSLMNIREGILRSIDPQGDLLMYMLSEKLINYDDREQIKSCRSRRAMAEMILDLVAGKSVHNETFKERFIRCLQRSGQKHIVALLDEDHDAHERIPAEFSPMTEEHHDVILTQLVHLVRSMDPEGDLLCHLRSRGVLDDREIDRIRNQRSPDEMNEVLLTEILPLKSDAAFQGLVEALRASDQPHVANLLILANACDEIPMSLDHRQFLTANSAHLTRHMEPRYELIPLMVERGVISYRDAERIQVHHMSSVMNEFILRLLARKADSAFQKFIDVLKDNQQSHVLTNCYGHNIEVELKITTQDPSQLNEAEVAIEKQLPSKLNNVEGNIIEGIRRKCIKVRLRCRSVDDLRRLKHMEQEGRLDQAFQGPIREILDARGIGCTLPVASVDRNEFNSCLLRFDEREMSEEHRRYLTMRHFNANIVTDNTLLEKLCDMKVLRNQEFLQIRSQLTMDQRREKLFDTLKRKPDRLFPEIKKAIESNPYGTIPRGRYKLQDFKIAPLSIKDDDPYQKKGKLDDDPYQKKGKLDDDPFQKKDSLMKVNIVMPPYNMSTLNDFENEDSANFELSNEMLVALHRMTN